MIKAILNGVKAVWQKKKWWWLIIILLPVGYWYYSKKSAPVVPTYQLAQVAKDTIVSGVSASGQMAAVNQIDIKPSVTAAIVSIAAKTGQAVKVGDVLATLDSQDLSDKYRQAKNNLDIARANLALKLTGLTPEDLSVAQKSLEASKLSYEKAQSDLPGTLLSADQSLEKSKRSLADAERNYQEATDSAKLNGGDAGVALDNAYAGARNNVGSALVSLRSSVTGMDNIVNVNNATIKNLYGALDSQSAFTAQNDLATAKTAVDALDTAYAQAGSDNAATEMVLAKAAVAAAAVKNGAHSVYEMLLNTVTSNNLSQSTLDGYRSSVAGYESSAAGSVTSLQSASQNIVNAKSGLSSSGLSGSSSVSGALSSLQTAQANLAQAQIDHQSTINTAQNDLANKKLTYESAQAQYQLKVAAPRPVDLVVLRSQIDQAASALELATSNLKGAQIKSPLDGIVAQITQKVGETAGPNAVLMTVITRQQIAEVNFNESDVVKLKVGQSAILTFSALDTLTAVGTVAEIDAIGTVTQGVVNYAVKISVDGESDLIKPQMSVSANIVVAQASDVLTVPASAVKNNNSGEAYVEVLPTTKVDATNTTVTTSETPERKIVTVGLSDDTSTQIVSGLAEGDWVITSTVTATAAKPTTQSGLSILGGGGGGGTFRGATGR